MGFKKVGKPIRSGRLQNSNSRKMRRGGGARRGTQDSAPTNPDTGLPFQIGESIIISGPDPSKDHIPMDLFQCPNCTTVATYSGGGLWEWLGWVDPFWTCSCFNTCQGCGCIEAYNSCQGPNGGCCFAACGSSTGACQGMQAPDSVSWGGMA